MLIFSITLDIFFFWGGEGGGVNINKKKINKKKILKLDPIQSSLILVKTVCMYAK